MNYELLCSNEELNEIIDSINEVLGDSLMSCHGRYHSSAIINYVENILSSLNYDERTIEMGKVAGLLHDIGCIEGKKEHAKRSANLCVKYLDKTDFTDEEKEVIIHAILDHSDGDCLTSPVGAALLIADKLNLSKDRVIGIGFNDEWHKNLCEIEEVKLIINDGLFIVDYIVTDKFSKEIFENGWKKALSIPAKGSKYFNSDCKFRINGVETSFE